MRPPVPPAAMRVVSLVPSWTETLHDLGAWDDVVGVTSFCVHPDTALEEKTVLGGTKSPNVDKVIALEPDLVVVCREENRREDVEALEDAGLEVLVTDPRTLEDAARETVRLGEAVDRKEAAEGIARDIREAVNEVQDAVAGTPPIRAFVPIWRDPWMTYNGDTFAQAVASLCGLENPWADASKRYPETTLEAVGDAEVEAVLLPSEPYAFTEEHLTLFQDLDPEPEVVLLDGEALTWYGSRTPWGLREVHRTVEHVRQRLPTTQGNR